VTANIVPGLFKELMMKRNDALNKKLGPLFSWLFQEPNPIGVNTMLMMLGACEPVFRLPYTARERKEREDGAKLLQSIGLENCPCGASETVRVLEDAVFKYTLGQ